MDEADGPMGGAKLERTHRAIARVGEAVERRDRGGVDALLGHPGVHERAPEPVRERVGQHRGEPVEGLAAELGELDDATPARKVQRGQLDTVLEPLVVVLEGVEPRLRIASHRADEPAPGGDLDHLRRRVGHGVDRRDEPWRTRRRDRPSSALRSRSSAIGLNDGAGGARSSSHDVRSRARTTRTRVESDEPLPDSRYRIADSETFDRSASSAWVRSAR